MNKYLPQTGKTEAALGGLFMTAFILWQQYDKSGLNSIDPNLVNYLYGVLVTTGYGAVKGIIEKFQRD